MGKVFRPSCLLASEDLRGGEICEVLVVHDDVDQKGGALQIVSLNAECLVYCEKFLVVHVVVEFRGSEDAGVKSDRVKLGVGGENGEDCPKGVVGGVGFNDDLGVRQPMGKNRSASERLLESIKCFPTLFGKVPRNTLPSESGERDNNVRVLLNEATVEITKT